MIYVTGDTHGDYSRFSKENFPEQKELTKQDYVIVCGDFGIWNDSPRQNRQLDILDEKPFTTLFVTGNHSNYDLLKTFEIESFCGGKAQFIRPSVIHLMRGQVFDIEGKRIFTMGGASCHDIEGGILSLDDPSFARKKAELDKKKITYRVDHLSWWKEELPSEAEYETAWENLEKADYQVDHIITHCPPESVRLLLEIMGARGYPKDSLTEFLERVKKAVRYQSWFFGHYHGNAKITDNLYLTYDAIIPLTEVRDF